MVQPLHAGNALRVFLDPPANAVRWKLLRKGNSSFGGHDDPTAVLAYEGDENVVLDIESVPNDLMQFYCAFYTSDNGATWSPSNIASGTARADFRDATTDVMSHLRDRIEAGLLVECQRGTFLTELGYIQVYTAPPSLEQGLRFPLVTVHLVGEEPADRGLGELLEADVFDPDSFDWQESEGWLANARVAVVGWSLNSDERVELRKALRRIVIGNLPVFDGLGWTQVAFSQQDEDSINGEYPSPIYQVTGVFSCQAPVVVAGDVDAVSDVQVTNRSSL